MYVHILTPNVRIKQQLPLQVWWVNAIFRRLTQGYSQRLLKKMGLNNLVVNQLVVKVVDFVRFGFTVIGFGVIAY